jgi:DNA repair protein RecN (Recombination protein N)
MLNALSLSFFVLIDSATITFDRGFHVLTGETGAGKTLLIQAIHLLSGRKVSTDIIRKGAEKAVIEATFDIQKLPMVHEILQESGIDFDPQEFLILKREISRTAKNRIFINSQMAPLSLLSRLAPYLLELVSQNSSESIRQTETQRILLDLYGDIDLSPFTSSYQSLQDLEKRLIALKSESQGDRLERLKWELEEWESFDYQEGEEDSLFEEYKTLANSQEITEKLTAVSGGLDHPNLIPTLAQFQKLVDDPSLSEHLQAAVVHLQEASFLASKQLQSLEYSPEKLQSLESRLSTLNQLKRKYHVEYHEINAHLKALKTQVDTLENLDERLDAIEQELHTLRLNTDELALSLTEKRTKTAKQLENQLTTELHSLNFPHAKVLIAVDSKEMGRVGKDQISFFLAANPGEEPASLSTRSSGGEIARFLFALKILLAEKGSLPTLIFDEIDASIGGETASVIGKKLSELGKHSQILAITHFPQVARHADHHLQISKKESDGRTITEISPLKASEKEKELLRMLGGESLNLFPE